VNGFRAVVNKEFSDLVNDTDPDILSLQETKAQNNEIETAVSSLSAYKKYYNQAERKGYAGTSLMSKVPPLKVNYDLGIAQHDGEGRIICAAYTHFILVNVYVPNSGQKLQRLKYRQTWDQDFLNYLKTLEKEKPLIIAGDFNVAHQPIDLKNDKANYNKTAGYTQVEIDGMDNFIDTGFVDTFRLMHPDLAAYTYWSYRFKARE